jgi:hypothetical protein
LVGVLLWLREFPIALCGDINKIHQVRVREEDSFVYLFLYAPKGQLEQDVYRMKNYIFGSVCSPAIFGHVLRRVSEDADTDDAHFVVEVEHQFYVDHWVTSFRTDSEAIAGAETLRRRRLQL